MDPFGHVVADAFGVYLKKGFDIRPTIAVTKVSGGGMDVVWALSQWR